MYKRQSTLNLPKTLFEMRAGLPKKEPVMLKDWDDNDLYNQLMKHNEGKPQFILHDGPPYANGNIHMGTALNKIIKDIIIRDKNMEGFQAPYVPGFDTHGLPIELKALSSVGEKKKDISKLELRQICEKFATEHIDIMSDQFKRLGVIGDFEHPYLTLKPEFEARQIEIFGEMAKKGYIYKGEYKGKYCTPCESFWTESQLVDGKCPDCGRECKPAKEEAYFFRMSKYADRLIELRLLSVFLHSFILQIQRLEKEILMTSTSLV